MLIREILIESRTDEAPVGMFKRGLTWLGAKAGSNKLKGAAEMQKMANSLYKDIEKWMGSSGVRQVDADNLLASPLFQGDSVMPGILDQMGVGSGVIPKNKLQQAVLAYAKEFNRTGGTVAQQPGQPATQGGEEPNATGNLHKDVELINLDPMILRYRGKDYHLDDVSAKWIDVKSNRPTQPAFQGFLNQQADIADGVPTPNLKKWPQNSATTTATPAAPVPTPSATSMYQQYAPAPAPTTATSTAPSAQGDTLGQTTPAQRLAAKKAAAGTTPPVAPAPTTATPAATKTRTDAPELGQYGQILPPKRPKKPAAKI